ncbi:hypothetical protein CKA32_000807 [Geitlerinema sp. FC II]|nr:hypothetical protein CKA32_000807 [Geitlerinema sp. FC II]
MPCRSSDSHNFFGGIDASTRATASVSRNLVDRARSRPCRFELRY